MVAFKESPKDAGVWKFQVNNTVIYQSQTWIVKKQAFIGADEQPCYFCEKEDTGKGQWLLERDLTEKSDATH